MLVYIFVYVLAAVLVFQGVNLLMERHSPTNVVPPEVRPAAAPALWFGVCLVAYGALLALAAIMSHGCPWLAGILPAMRNLGFAGMTIYGLWLIFGRKVNYSPAAAPAGAVHGH
jgi:hypothetical protein